VDALRDELRELSAQHQFKIQSGDREIDDVLTYALFPQVALKFFRSSGDPSAFEAVPRIDSGVSRELLGEQVYSVEVEGMAYVVKVTEGGEISAIETQTGAPVAASPSHSLATAVDPIRAPLAGTVVRVVVVPGQVVVEGQAVLILEAMKMETSVSAPRAGTIDSIAVNAGDSVAVGDVLISLK
jgi:oxaloacetate decarboxylase alpha subunit